MLTAVFMLAAVLKRRGELAADQISAAIAAEFGRPAGRWQVETLNGMIHEGYVEVDGRLGAPSRRRYRLTKAGVDMVTRRAHELQTAASYVLRLTNPKGQPIDFTFENLTPDELRSAIDYARELGWNG